MPVAVKNRAGKRSARTSRAYARLRVCEITEDPENEFKHSELQIERLCKSLARFGQPRAIIVDDKNVCVAGNGILTAARRLGWETIRCKRTSLTGALRAGYRQADNMTQRLARLDSWLMAATLKQLDQVNALGDVAALGFDDESFARALEPGAWQGRTLDLSTIEDYDPDAETFVIKVANVRRSDAERLVERVTGALEGTGYAATIH